MAHLRHFAARGRGRWAVDRGRYRVKPKADNANGSAAKVALNGQAGEALPFLVPFSFAHLLCSKIEVLNIYAVHGRNNITSAMCRGNIQKWSL